MTWLRRLLWPYLCLRYGRRFFTGDAASHVQQAARAFCRGTGIDFGAGRWPLDGATPVDLGTDLQLADIPAGSQDYVFSSHALEHVRDWRGTLAEFRRVLRPGGVAFLYLPHEDFAPWNAETWMGRVAGHVWQPRLETLMGYAALNGWRVRAVSPKPDAYMSWLIVLEVPR